MHFKQLIRWLSLLVFFSVMSNAQADTYSTDCKDLSSNEALANCNVMSKSPIISSQYVFVLNDISKRGADTLLNIYYGTDVKHFESDKTDEKKNDISADMASMVLLVINIVSYFYLCAALIAFVKHLSHAAKNGEIAGKNGGFAMMNQAILFMSAGMSGVIYAICIAYLIGGYTATVLSNTITPKLANISDNESSTVYTSVRETVNQQAPVTIAKLVRVFIATNEIRQTTYSSFSTEWKNGVLVQKASTTVVDEKGVSRIFNGFADCIKEPTSVGEMKFGVYIEPENVKLQKCLELKETKYRTPLIAYHGESTEITDAMSSIIENAKKIAQYTRELACTTGLNLNDRRNKYKDSPAIYAQCTNMSLQGSVAENGEPVTLYNSSVSQSDIDKLFQESVDILVAAEMKYVEKLIADKTKSTKEAVGHGDIITNAYSLFFQTYSDENEVSQKAMEEFSQISIAADGADTLNTSIAVLLGVSTQDTSAFDGNVYRQNLINFDKVYEQTISPLVNQTSALNNLAGMADAMFTRGYYANGGMNLKNCFKEGVECKTPIINQVATQTHNGIVMVDGLIQAGVATGLIKSGLEQKSTTDKRRAKSEADSIKSTALQMRSNKILKLVNTFQTVQTFLTWSTAFFLAYLVFQSGYYIGSLVGQLLEWTNDFPKNVIGHSADMIKQSANIGDEIGKTENIYAVIKRIGWSVFAPNLSICLFFVNFGVLNLALTIADSMVFSISGSVSIADSDMISQIYQIIIYAVIKAIVIMALSGFIIHQSSQMYTTVKKWFGVRSDIDAAQQGIEYIQKMEDKIRRRAL